MTLTAKEHAAITFDHLLTFMAQVDLFDARMDTQHLHDLLCAAISADPHDPANKFLVAALELLRSSK